MKTNKDKKRKAGRKEKVTGLLMASPPLIGFLLFGIIPIIYSFVLSFMQLNNYDITTAVWNGLENYQFVLKDERFLKAIRNTLLFTLHVPVNMLLSLLLASLVTQKIKGVKIFRTILFIPYVCSAVATSTMWKWLYDTKFGVFNDFLRNFGIEIPWLTDEKVFMISILVMTAWSGTGYGMLLYQSALNNVSETLYEAASIDGANKFAMFTKITLPLISPTTFFLLVTGLIGAMQSFDIFQIMGGEHAGPGESGLTVVFYLYRMAFKDTVSYGLGYASATAWILSIVIITLTVLNFILSKRWVYDE